ncbi:TetR/AcrR family transcriptional regulator [Pseudolysinimonas sp.]|uniref:TetR/AcrR family transcriptional regulator n=1 Tax=Pseudolysinimonas sp. TaxID=2680009 RepID=UPI003F7DC1FB
MGDERRTRLTPDERRAQLVALGVAALADSPLEDVTIELLGQRAGVSRALVFHYFGSKQGLHHAIVGTARDSMLRATELRPELPPLDRLRDTLDRVVAFVREHPATFYSLVRGAASGSLQVRELVDEARQAQAERAVSVFLELGERDSPALRIGLRAWVAMAEQELVDAGIGSDIPGDEIVELLMRTAQATADAVAPIHR